MANLTLFQRLSKVFSGSYDANNYTVNTQRDSNILYKAKDSADYENKKLQARQQNLLARQWRKASYDITNKSLVNLNNIKMMYRDADIMDDFPEIGTALDIVMEESTYAGDKGFVINISSKSERIKSILQDLFVNRLAINTQLPMICRSMCKYGNTFMLLNIDGDNGIIGWKMLPVYEVDRFENGMENPYANAYVNLNNVSDKADLSTKFVWVGQNSYIPYLNWQIAHFRLLYNSLYLPYGMSFLNKARRHFRMLSMMEDMMLIYRLERSIERRVFKINVGAIDEADVPAYVQQIADNFKRTPIVDPMTGQIDLRKNLLPVWGKTPIPLLDGRTVTIEDLSTEYKNGKINYVYSVQDNTLQIVPGKVVWCGKNYTASSMVKITLDDDTYMVMAPEHEVLMRDGSKKRADKLVHGESIMPLYRICDKKAEEYLDRYEKTYNPSSGKYEFTHRLIAGDIIKENKEHNTVHHKDFNKYNNSPENLLWCNFHEHHKMHSQVAKNNWEKNRESIIKKFSQNRKDYYKNNPTTQETKNKISNTLKNTWNNEKYRDFFVNKGKKLAEWAKFGRGRRIVRERAIKNNFGSYGRLYNESELHKQHDEIRKQNKLRFWKYGDAEQTKRKMTVFFDEYIWDELRGAVLLEKIYNRITLLEYINVKLMGHLLDINTNKRLHKLKRISLMVLKTRLRERGFIGAMDFINSIKKNHKVKSVEFINGDDVYCMTVVGLNGEDDRHNFALTTFVGDNKWSSSGCFVSNCDSSDFFIPVREDGAANPIETLPAAQNLTAMDDIKFMQNKVLTALRVPKSFLNFEEAQGDGKNLSLLDIRFSRTVNRIQQYLIMELNKVAMIHLMLLGFEDELTNFTITMNNPSSQAEMLELENTAKKVTTAKDAITDGGNGIPLMSVTRAWKTIMKWTDKEISDNMEELRLEKALAAELERTSEIIKRTGVFDPVDNIYGETGAEYSDNAQDEENGGEPSGGIGGGSFGGGTMDFGEDMGGETENLEGSEGEMDMGEAASEEGGEEAVGQEGLGESYMRNMLTEIRNKQKIVNKSIETKGKHYSELLRKKIEEETKRKENETDSTVPLLNKTFIINEELNELYKQINDIIKE